MSAISLRANDGTTISGTESTEYLDGIEHKHLVAAIDGRKWLLKYNDNGIEIDAKSIALMLGAPMANVLSISDGANICGRDNESAVAIEWIDGADTYANIGRYVDRRPSSVMVLDFVIANTDRHANNILSVNGDTVAIDHGFSFGMCAYQSIPELSEIAVAMMDHEDGIATMRRMVAKLSFAISGTWSLTFGDTAVARSRMVAAHDYLSAVIDSYSAGSDLYAVNEGDFKYDEYDRVGGVDDVMDDDRDDDDCDCDECRRGRFSYRCDHVYCGENCTRHSWSSLESDKSNLNRCRSCRTAPSVHMSAQTHTIFVCRHRIDANGGRKHGPRSGFGRMDRYIPASVNYVQHNCGGGWVRHTVDVIHHRSRRHSNVRQIQRGYCQMNFAWPIQTVIIINLRGNQTFGF